MTKKQLLAKMYGQDIADVIRMAKVALSPKNATSLINSLEATCSAGNCEAEFAVHGFRLTAIGNSPLVLCYGERNYGLYATIRL